MLEEFEADESGENAPPQGLMTDQLKRKLRNSKLFLQAAKGQWQECQALISLGADPKFRSNGRSCFFQSMSSRCPLTMAVFHAAGADMGELYSGYPPIFFAASTGLPQAISFLVGKGASLDTEWDLSGNLNSPLHLAVSFHQPASAQRLLELGADMHVQSIRKDARGVVKKQSTPLELSRGTALEAVFLSFLARKEAMKAMRAIEPFRSPEGSP